MYKILKDFSYAENIYKTVSLKKCDTHKIDPSAAKGLLKDGFIGKIDTAKVVETKVVKEIEKKPLLSSAPIKK